jgi:hypothetical protein
LPAFADRGGFPVPRTLVRNTSTAAPGQGMAEGGAPGGVVRPVSGARHPLALQEEVLERVDRSKIFFNTLDQGPTPLQNRQSYGL